MSSKVPTQHRETFYGPLIGASALLSCTLCLFLPHQIFIANLSEYALGFGELASHLLRSLLTAFAMLLAIGIAFMRYRPIYIIAVFSLGMAMWIQGSFMSASYGSLDGRDLEFSTHDWRSFYELPMWGGMFLGFALLRKKLLPLIPFIVVVFLGLQVAAAVLTPTGLQMTRASATDMDAGFYRLSGSNDVLHILLDGFGSPTFDDVLTQNPNLSEHFQGFTYFPDTVGSFSTTHPAVASATTGTLFDFQTPLANFLTQQLEKKAIDAILENKSFDTRLVTTSRLCSYMARSCRSAMNLDGNYASAKAQAAQLIGMGLFRASPHILKPMVYQRGAWVHFIPIAESEAALLQKPYLWFTFFRDYTKNLRLDDSAKPTYRLLHLEFPHPPYIFNRDCTRLDRQPGNFANALEQATCATKLLTELFEKLRQLGVYDQVSIIIHGDHGSHYEVQHKWPAGHNRPTEWFASRSSPVLLIKPRQASGALTTSSAQATLTDVKPTVLDMAGFPDEIDGGTSLLRLKEHTKRIRFHWGGSIWQDDAANPMDAKLFRIDGPHLNPESWSFVTDSGSFSGAYPDVGQSSPP